VEVKPSDDQGGEKNILTRQTLNRGGVSGKSHLHRDAARRGDLGKVSSPKKKGKKKGDKFVPLWAVKRIGGRRGEC